MAKSFISVVFFSDKVQIVKSSKGGSLIEKFGSFPIPDGLVVNYKVQAEEQLVELLKSALKQLKISDKFAGVVVPEFSTFTKTLDMPPLTSHELDEAVRWRAQEFLPVSLGEAVMDWQVIEKADTQVKVLAAAILKDILAEYVDVVGKAGLQPLVVETPSLSLVRVVPDGGDGRLIMYISENETILVVAKERAILGSSVVRNQSPNEILRTAQLISGHYEGVSIKKVYIAGVGFDQAFVNNLAATLQKGVDVVNYEVVGMAQPQVHEYLISLSLQKKDPAEPRSEKTINLLPPGWASHYRNKVKGSRIWTVALTSAFVAWSGFLVALIAFMILSQQAINLEDQASGNGNGNGRDVGVRIGEINALSSQVLLVTGAPPPQSLVNVVEEVRPEEVEVQQYTVNFDSGTVSVEGFSTTRNALVSFRDILSDREQFLKVELPLSAIVEDRDIRFNMTLSFIEVKTTQAPRLRI